MVTSDDIQRYATENTDFGFEMKVVRALRTCGCAVEHSGTYTDPVSKKNREFDIRITKRTTVNLPFYLHLSVECKNLTDSFPLVVQMAQRTKMEAFHEVIYFLRDRQLPHIERSTSHSRYEARQQDWVAKSFDQVCVQDNGKLKSNDGKTFDKMSQAIASSKGLLSRCRPTKEASQDSRHVVLPVLVIPDNCLWRVRYGENGETIGTPDKIESCQYFINQQWMFEYQHDLFTYSISHLEIVTLSAIREFLKTLIGIDDDYDDPRDLPLFRIKGD